MSSDGLTVQGLRADLDREFLPRSERALRRWDLTLDEHQIGGMPCQVIKPAAGDVQRRILYFFGGGYVSGCPEYDLPITAALAVQAKAEVIAPRYPLAPEHPHPAALEAMRPVYMALQDQEGALSVAGESAGGGLACALVQGLIRDVLPTPEAMALFSPWVDLNSDEAGLDDPTLDADMVSYYARQFLGRAAPSDPEASPLCGRFGTAWPATYLSTGTRDHFQPMVHRLKAAIEDGGAECRFFEGQDMWHVFEAYDEAEPAEHSLAQAAAFLKERS